LREFLNNVREDHPHIAIGVFDRDGEGLREYKQLRNDYSEQNDFRISKSRNAAALLLPIPPGREEYARFENLCIEYYFADSCLQPKTPEGYGLIFEFPPITQRIGSTSIVETIPNTRLETRKIRSGKSVFAKKIVPTLPPNEFESFKPLFERIIELVQILDAQKPTGTQLEFTCDEALDELARETLFN
jgi:hypothetical protein